MDKNRIPDCLNWMTDDMVGAGAPADAGEAKLNEWLYEFFDEYESGIMEYIQDAMQEFVQSKEPVEYGEHERGCDKYHQQKDDEQ